MSYIKGTFTKSIYTNDDNGYVVGILKIKETDLDILESRVCFVGNFFDLRLKNNYIMHGEMSMHSRYGNQFVVSGYEIMLPSKKDELIEFLSSDLFPIGIKTATRIVDRFSDDTLDIILNSPESLQLIPKLPKSRIDKIHNVLVDYQSSSQIVIDLQSLGFTTKQALFLVNKYKSKCMDIISDNIYDLVNNIDFYFNEIDNIALNSGISVDDDRRICALIIHIINDITFMSGDTYTSRSDIKNSILKYIHNISDEVLDKNLYELNKNHLLVIVDDRYYLKEFYKAEEYISSRLCYLNDLPSYKFSDLEKKITELEKDNNIVYDNIQKSAIIKAISSNFTIITGGPGTGKTTIILAIVSLLKSIFNARDEEVALLAPTGRASKRMMETVNMSAYTIHRYLGWDKENNSFSFNKHNQHKEKYIIIDEASMLDTVLMDALLKGIKKDVKLILVGDYYQLPSVSQGQVLKDLIDSDVFDIIKLNYLYRQNEDSYIPCLAQEIKDKDISESFMFKKDDFNFIDCDNQNVISNVCFIVNKAIEKGYGDKDIQILAPIYKSLNGIDNLNVYLQKIFNPKSDEKKELKLSNITYRVGDKVLQLVNDADFNVFNGDIGYIIDIIDKSSESKKREIVVDYDGNIVRYPPDKFINIRHAYAISVHKAQGSEFPMVIMPVVNNYNRMLYNKLIYTAVTRAKRSLILVGDRKCFIDGVKNDYVDVRNTTLKAFILDNYMYK